jgi:hypothetical protein
MEKKCQKIHMNRKEWGRKVSWVYLPLAGTSRVKEKTRIWDENMKLSHSRP